MLAEVCSQVGEKGWSLGNTAAYSHQRERDGVCGTGVGMGKCDGGSLWKSSSD